jgi:hypothetical protein
LPTAVDINTNGLLDLGTDSSETLGKFFGGQAIPWQAIMIKPLQLLELIGLESLQFAVDRFDGESLLEAKILWFNSTESVGVLS